MVNVMNIRAKRHKGAALIVSLVLLVVALLLGLSSFQSSRLDESMAGNQRASNLALMAAELGASDFWFGVRNNSVTGPGDPGENETVASYTTKILKALADWADNPDPDSDVRFDVDSCVEIDDDNVLSNVCYKIKIGTIQTSGENSDIQSLFVTSEGIVFSGDKDVNGNPLDSQVVARRHVGINFSAMLGESLSALNFACELDDYDGIASQSEIGGEEVDGYVNPAISVTSRAEAEMIVRDILGNNDGRFNRDAIFIPDDPKDYNEEGVYGNIAGVYHHIDAVDFNQTPPAYVGNYDGCKNGSTRLCNYKGGVASTLGTPILSDPEQFDRFIGLLASQDNTVWGDAETVKSEPVPLDIEDGQVFFVTNQAIKNNDDDGKNNNYYLRPVYDDPSPERDVFDLGGFDHKGVLIVDGDVEFSGNPQFEGLIIVLGDIKISGGGGDPFVGAVISAPYSVNFFDESGDLVTPERGVFEGEEGFLNANGHLVAPLTSKVVMHSNFSESYYDNGTLIDGLLDDFPVFVDENGDLLLDGDGDLIEPYFGDASDTLTTERFFDPCGFSVDGGGSLDYSFDYSVIEKAFNLMDDKTLLSWLIGQRNPDGSFEYGISSWREVVKLQ